MMDKILFQGAKEKTSNVSGPTLSGRGRPRAARTQGTTRTARPTATKPGRPGAPPEQTDAQRRARAGVERVLSRRPGRTQNNVPTPEPEATPRRRRLRPKPRRNG